MRTQITLEEADGELIVRLPRQMLERLNLGPGETISAVETERGVLLTPFDPERAAGEAFQEVRRQYRGVLRKLAE
jgi:antitoxin component of MazEF toxin-antitoxin module